MEVLFPCYLNQKIVLTYALGIKCVNTRAWRRRHCNAKDDNECKHKKARFKFKRSIRHHLSTTTNPIIKNYLILKLSS